MVVGLDRLFGQTGGVDGESSALVEILDNLGAKASVTASDNDNKGRSVGQGHDVMDDNGKLLGSVCVWLKRVGIMSETGVGRVFIVSVTVGSGMDLDFEWNEKTRLREVDEKRGDKEEVEVFYRACNARRRESHFLSTTRLLSLWIEKMRLLLKPRHMCGVKNINEHKHNVMRIQKKERAFLLTPFESGHNMQIFVQLVKTSVPSSDTVSEKFALHVTTEIFIPLCQQKIMFANEPASTSADKWITHAPLVQVRGTGSPPMSRKKSLYGWHERSRLQMPDGRAVARSYWVCHRPEHF